EIAGEKDLAVAGGVALHCGGNLKLLGEGPFESIYVQSAAGDAGGALGAALYMTHVIGGIPRRPALNHAFLGAPIEKWEVARFFSDCGVPFRRFDTTTDMCRAVADCLMAGEGGGWGQGRFEDGPRGPGGRAILSDPRQPGSGERVNRENKVPQEFRAFAP